MFVPRVWADNVHARVNASARQLAVATIQLRRCFNVRHLPQLEFFTDWSVSDGRPNFRKCAGLHRTVMHRRAFHCRPVSGYAGAVPPRLGDERACRNLQNPRILEKVSLEGSLRVRGDIAAKEGRAAWLPVGASKVPSNRKLKRRRFPGLREIPRPSMEARTMFLELRLLGAAPTALRKLLHGQPAKLHIKALRFDPQVSFRYRRLLPAALNPTVYP